MTKYNHFAQELNAAFLDARKEYREAFEFLQNAKSKMNSTTGDPMKIRRAALEYQVAQDEFAATEKRVWAEIDQKHDELTAALRAEIKADYTVRPDAVDTNALELLKSGVMKESDFYAMRQQFDGNDTMTRLIGRYAKEMGSTEMRALAMQCEAGATQKEETWGAFKEAIDFCSGRRHGRRERPEYIVKCGEWWEQLTGGVVEGF